MTNRTSTVLIALASVLLVLVLITGSQSLGSQTFANTNITRSEYEAALAKWDKSHVTEYEAKVQEPFYGKWKIVVHIDYGQRPRKESVIYAQNIDGTPPDTTDTAKELLPTVSDLYQWVDDYLNDPSSYETNTPGENAYYYVLYDPVLGYPSSFTLATNYIGSYEVTIQDVKVLK